MNIATLLDHRARETPDKIALREAKKSISFAELRDKSLYFASELKAQGVCRGQHALLAIPLSIELYVVFLALMRLQVSVVLIDPTVGKAKMTQYLDDIPVELFIAVPKAHLLRLVPAIARIPMKFTTRAWLPFTRRICRATTAIFDFKETPAETLALITFTSGSTGRAKAIGRSHGFLCAQHRAIEQSLGQFVNDIELSTLPVFILSSLASGMTVSLPQASWEKSEKLLKQIRAHSVNRLLASPAFCQQLVQYLEDNKQTEENITRIFTGGGPVFPNLLSRLKTVFPKAQITSVYGSSEAEPIAEYTYRADAKVPALGLLAGKPCDAVQLAIIVDQNNTPLPELSDDEFNTLKCPCGQIGEIVVTGLHVQKAYLNNDGKRDKIRVGETIWHRTGDAGLIDDLGNLYLQGRCSAKIKRNIDGKRRTLYPFAYEAVAQSISGVARAGIVSLADEIILAIELQQNASRAQADIKSQLEQCESLKNVIDQIVFVDKIPVDSRHQTKVLYPQLRAML